jgi:pimeloyl-ACP methyl ester carboxylesterase
MGNRKPVVFLSGLLSDAAVWQRVLTLLGDMIHPVIPDLSQDDSIPAMGRRVLAAAPPRFSLAGFSMGGYVAMEIMRIAPERVGRLALLGASARTDTPDQAKRRSEAIRLAEAGSFREIVGRMLPYLVHPDRLNDATLVSAIREMADRLGRDGFLRKQRAIIGRIDSRPYLPQIACPTLVLCGREDASAPLSLQEEIAALAPGAKLQIIERCGHMSPIERPDQVAAALRAWLQAGLQKAAPEFRSRWVDCLNLLRTSI